MSNYEPFLLEAPQLIHGHIFSPVCLNLVGQITLYSVFAP